MLSTTRFYYISQCEYSDRGMPYSKIISQELSANQVLQLQGVQWGKRIHDEKGICFLAHPLGIALFYLVPARGIEPRTH